jgi:hypothetical protein
MDIWRYIAQDSPVNADRLLDWIRDAMNQLAAFDGAGPC